MITVHHLEYSRSTRILWLLEELELPYEIKVYQRDPKTMYAPASLKEVHPLGRAPVISDGDQNIAESGAIIEYLVDRYGEGKLKPAADTPERIQYTYWLHYAEGSLMPLLLLKLVFQKIQGPQIPFFLRPVTKAIAGKVGGAFIDPRLKEAKDFLESSLSQSTWFAGEDFSAADIQMSYPVEALAERTGLDGAPKLKAFLARINERPAHQKAIEKGGDTIPSF